MMSKGYGKLLVGCVVGLVVLGATTMGLGFGEFGGEPAGVDTDSAAKAGELTVSGMHVPEEVRASESLRVRVEVTNTASTTKSQRIAVQLGQEDGNELTSTVATEQVEVPAGDTRTVTLEAAPQQVSPETTVVGVAIGDDSSPATTQSVTLLQSPTFELTDETEPNTVVRGDDVSLRTTVTNAGDYRGLQIVRLAVDSDQDGTFGDSETVNASVYSLAGGESQTIAVPFPTDELEPGEYEYRMATENETTTGTVTVQQPATVRIQNVSTPENVTRGSAANVTTTVRNVGDVEGTTTVELRNASNVTIYSRSVSLRSNETTTVSFAVNTTNRSRGTHEYSVWTAADNDTVSLRVQDSHFEVSELEGPKVLYVGETAVFSATVTNTGEIAGSQSVQHRIDSDGDDRPEAYGVNENVTLAPDESARVTFELEYTVTDTTDYPVEPLKLETYVYGIYSEDTRASTAMSVKPAWAKDSSGGSGDGGSVSNGERASLDEITQDKYGRYYDEVSGETKRQVEEIHERQPFADGLVAAEVRTREEIARQDFGADVQAGDKFDFTELDIEVQQGVEAEFDAQFESESGDRIESWDELAQEQYGTTYENLTDEQQTEVRASYRAQFE